MVFAQAPTLNQEHDWDDFLRGNLGGNLEDLGGDLGGNVGGNVGGILGGIWEDLYFSNVMRIMQTGQAYSLLLSSREGARCLMSTML